MTGVHTCALPICVKCDGKKNQKPDEVVSYDSYNIKTDDESRAKIVSAVILNQNVSLKLESKGDFLIVISDNAKIYINTLRGLLWAR